MTDPVKNGWTERIEFLEAEVRRLKAEKGEAGKIRAEMDLAPVWDARTELSTFAAILGAVYYLVKPDEEGPEKEEILTTLTAIQEKISDIAHGLDNAIQGMTLKKETAA